MTKLQLLQELRKTISDFSVNGLDNFPLDTPSIVIANHTCLMDILYLPMAIPTSSVTLVGAGTLFKNSKKKHIERQQIIDKYLYTMPIEAHGSKELAYMCLEYANRIASSGIAINVFPEGAYANDNVIHKGKTGASRILFAARENGIPINLVPVAIDVIDDNLDMNTFSETIKSKVIISILDPIDYHEAFDSYANSSSINDKRSALHMPIDIGMQQIATKLNRRYADEYIPLTPRDTIILPNGSSINAQAANSHLTKYENELATRSRNLIRDIKKTKH